MDSYKQLESTALETPSLEKWIIQFQNKETDIIPPVLRLPKALINLFITTWEKSEAAYKEMGGNLVLEDQVINFHGEIATGIASGETVQIPDSQGIPSCIGDFHTHPSEPSKTWMDSGKRAHLPPSVQDFDACVSVAQQGERRVWVSFVVAHPYEIYALLYLNGDELPGIDLSNLRVLAGDKDEEINQILDPTALNKVNQKLQVASAKLSPQDFEAFKLQELQELRKDTSEYGEKARKIDLRYLKRACELSGVILYVCKDREFIRKEILGETTPVSDSNCLVQ